jgi:hypothetical protein
MPPKRIEVILVGFRSWRKRSSLVGSHCCCKKIKNRSAMNNMDNGSINPKKTLK